MTRDLSKFRERVTVQNPNKAAAGSGQLVPAWAVWIKRHAQILPKATAEGIRVGQLRSETTHVVVLPSDAEVQEIKAKDRILWGTRTLHVLGNINRDGKEIERELECRERNR